MVWFQCEDCGDNLKKPKLPNHFRMCSASKLSCIDCGQVFGQQNVESHTQCLTEAEKYGPKGQGKPINGSNAKPNNASKRKPDIDLNVGLSKRAPWSCSLCNTKVTSRETLLLHAEGKKHIAKAKAFHAANQQPKQAEGTLSNADVQNGNNVKNETLKSTEKQEEERPSDVATKRESNDAANGDLKSTKKRKLESSENVELGNGEVTQVGSSETEKSEHSKKKVKGVECKDDKAVDASSTKEEKKGKIKWKKLITSSLRSNPNGKLKLKKLIKLVSKSLKESGHTVDENQVPEILEQKISSSSRFDFDGKYVRLSTKI